MKLTSLQSDLNTSYYNNGLKDENQQNNPFSTIQDNRDLFNIPLNQLLTKEKVTDVILRSRKSPYTVILVEENYQGTLNNLLYQKGLKLKKDIDKIQCDIFLVGGGAAGGSYMVQDKYQNPTGEIQYEKNKIISINSIVEINIGKGGEGIKEQGVNFKDDNKKFFIHRSYDGKYGYIFGNYGASVIDGGGVPYTKEILPNNGNKSIFITDNLSLQSKGGSLLVDKYISYYPSEYPGKGESKESDITEEMKYSSGYIETPVIYIPHTNIRVCKSLKNESKSFPFKEEKRYSPNYYIYWNGEKNNKKIAYGEKYLPSGVDGVEGNTLTYTIYEVNKNNNISYGGNNVSSRLYCSTYIPDEINNSMNYIGQNDFYCINGIYKTILSSFLQGYDFRQAETGDGGDGVCAIIVRGDYFE